MEEKIYFGELTESGMIKYTKEWTARTNNSAAVFSEDNNADLENAEILIIDLNENIIIKTKFIKLTESEFVNTDKEIITYISENTINFKSLDGYEGDLYITVPSINFTTKIFVENKANAITSLIGEVLTKFNENSQHNDEDSNCSFDTFFEKYEVINEEEESTRDYEEYRNFDLIEKDSQEKDSWSFEDSLVEYIEDAGEDESIIFTEENNDDVEVKEIKDLDNIHNDENKRLNVIDKIKYIVNAFIEAPHLDIKIDDFVKDTSKLDANIIIEKVNNRYIATIAGIGFRSFKMLDSDDNAYFIFDGEPNKFLEKVKNKLRNMYSMNENDLQQLKVIMILDNINEIYEESIEVISRDEAINLIALKGVNVIKIEDKNIELSFVNESERRLKLSADLSGTLGIKGFIEELISNIDSEIKVFGLDSENNEFEYLTDMLI